MTSAQLKRSVAGHEMTKHILPSPNQDVSLLLRELNHRINNELTCAICTVSASAMESDNVAVKAALLDVVDLLQQCADVHRALHMPDQKRLTDVAKYLEQLCFSMTKYRLERLAIRVLFSADDLLLEGERCWKLGLIVSDALGLHGTKENAALKVSDTFGQQRRIAESRRPFDAAAT